MIEANKEALDVLKRLRAAGAYYAWAYFDGSGDSGQLEEVGATDANETPIGWPLAADDKSVLYDLLDEILGHSEYDWYNNEGGFGNVYVNLATGEVRIDMNVRITDSEHYDEDFTLEGVAVGSESDDNHPDE